MRQCNEVENRVVLGTPGGETAETVGSLRGRLCKISQRRYYNQAKRKNYVR